MPQQFIILIFAAAALLVIGGVSFLSSQGSLNNIKSKPVGDGQHGTARWATPKKIGKTFHHVPFRPAEWRKGMNRPKVQGLVLGSLGKKGRITALVDSDDIHCLMIGAAGVGKTAFFLYPNLEYACACGMSFLALDTVHSMCLGAIAEISAPIEKQIDLSFVQKIIDCETAQLIRAYSVTPSAREWKAKSVKMPQNSSYNLTGPRTYRQSMVYSRC